jgi:structural maintenance of chromosome 2
MADCKTKRKALEECFQQKKNKINPKVMAMIDSVEKKEANLKKNMSTVVKDKTKIEETIVKLDEYKKEALHKTWTTVNRDFGAIFNELLPGSFAKLDPPEGKTISEGLEVKVMLGKVWKQSLTELSGGQRYAQIPYAQLTCTDTRQLINCSLPYHGTTAVQTGTNVHPR